MERTGQKRLTNGEGGGAAKVQVRGGRWVEDRRWPGGARRGQSQRHHMQQVAGSEVCCSSKHLSSSDSGVSLNKSPLS